MTQGLQVEHRKGFAALGPTDLENCALMCQRHHDMKTYLGFVLGWNDDGSRSFRPPDDYLDPEPPDPAVGTLAASSPWTGRFFDTAAEDPQRRNLVGAASSGTAP